MASSLITDLLKTPSQIRKENDQRLLTEGLAQAQLATQGNTLGGVGGMFANFGAQQAAQTGRNISNAFRGVTDAIGTVTGADLRPADERAAGQAQALARSIDMKDPASIRAGADKMRQFNPKAAEALEGRATALEAKLSASATAAEQTRYDRSQDAIKNAQENLRISIQQGKTESEIAIAEAELALMQATTPIEIEKARQELAQLRADTAIATGTLETTIAAKNADNLITIQTAPDVIAQAQADLNSTLAGTKLTQANTTQTNQNIAQASEMFGYDVATKLSALDSEALKRELDTFQLERGRAMMPHELRELTLRNDLISEQTRTQISQQLKNASDIERAKQPLDEFTRMLELSDITPKERTELIRERAIAMAKGGDQAFDPNDSKNKARLDVLQKYVAGYQSAKDNSYRYEAMMEFGAFANIGSRSSLADIATGIASFLGLGNNTKAANELIDVLSKGMTLENASELAGAISEKELVFLQEMIPGRTTTPEAFYTHFADKAAGSQAKMAAIRDVEDLMVSGELMSGEAKRTTISDVESVYKFLAYQPYATKFKPLGGEGVAQRQYSDITQAGKDAFNRLSAAGLVSPRLQSQMDQLKAMVGG